MSVDIPTLAVFHYDYQITYSPSIFDEFCYLWINMGVGTLIFDTALNPNIKCMDHNLGCIHYNSMGGGDITDLFLL